MSMVFDRYPNGGGEMLLALSLADWAEDDGTRVFPSIKQLAEKTRQSERTVQYQLRRMEKSGWLILINSGNGGRNQRREYVINPDWIKGAEIAPIIKGATDDIKGADSGNKGCNSQQKRVQRVAPAYTHHISINNTSNNHQRVREKKSTNVSPDDLKNLHVDEQIAIEFLELRKQKKARLTPIALAGIQREADKAGISLNDALRTCIERGWQGFNADWIAQSKIPASKSEQRTAWNQQLDRAIAKHEKKEIYMGVIDAGC